MIGLMLTSNQTCLYSIHVLMVPIEHNYHVQLLYSKSNQVCNDVRSVMWWLLDLRSTLGLVKTMKLHSFGPSNVLIFPQVFPLKYNKKP